MNALSPRGATFLRWVSGIVIAVIVSLLLWSYINRDDLIAGCQRNSSRAALDASYKMRTADARRAAGDPNSLKAADDYDAFARGLLDTIPLPAEGTTVNVAAVEKVKGSDGEYRFKLTAQAKRIQHDGCAEAFPPLFDNIK